VAPARVGSSGINFLLNGIDTTMDFFPAGIHEVHPAGAFHDPVPATPEASQVAAVAAVLTLGVFRWRRSRAVPRS